MTTDKIARKIGLLHSSSTETPTSFELCRLIVSQIPGDWESPDFKFLDPCCGRGNMLLAAAERLEKIGHAKEHIVKNMLYGCDISKVQSMIAQKALYLFYSTGNNILNDNALTKEWNMKFSAIATNPPYQSTNVIGTKQPKSHNLWSKFVTKAIDELVEDDGYVAMVTPDSWMSANSQILEKFKENNLLWCNTNVSEYFSEGSSFTAWVVQKQHSGQRGVIDGIKVDFSKINYLPRDFHNTYPVHDKVINSKFPKLEILVDTTCHSDRKHEKLSDTTNNVYKFLTFHTNAQTKYSRLKSKHFDNSKIIWTLSGYFKPFYDPGQLGTTEICQYVLVKNEDEATCILSFLNSRLYQFIIKTGKWSGFLNGKVICNLPRLPNKIYTDIELYDLFGLTPEERSYVDANAS